jgi:hypothetical protein
MPKMPENEAGKFAHLSWQERQWAGPSLPQIHKDLVTLERGGPSPYRAVEPWLLLLLLLLLSWQENNTG